MNPKMLHLKILLSCFCLHAVAASIVLRTDEEFPAVELPEATPISSEDVTPKANWSAVCPNVEVNPVEAANAAPGMNVEMPGVVISPGRSPESSAKACAAPNGLGLQNLLNQTKLLIPFDRVKAIISNAASDPEVRRFRELIRSEDFRSKVRRVLESRHFAILRDYVCKSLYLDVDRFWEHVRILLPIEDRNEAAEAGLTESAIEQTGLLGFLQDLDQVLPKQKLHHLFESLLKSDEDLVAALKRIHSDEFGQLLQNLTEVKEFNELSGMLQEFRVPVQSVMEWFYVTLGWYVNELEGNFENY